MTGKTYAILIDETAALQKEADALRRSMKRKAIRTANRLNAQHDIGVSELTFGFGRRSDQAG